MNKIIKHHNNIYLDYAATTPMDPRVIQKMYNYLIANDNFGNSISQIHYFGQKVHEDIEKARYQIAKIIGGNPQNIIFTSSASESINLAIKGIIYKYPKKKHIITCVSEHAATLQTCYFLEKQNLCDVTYLIVSNIGLIDLDCLEDHIKHNTILISIMHVNNEIGIIQDIQHIGEICKQKNIFFHVDATQSIGKYPFNLSNYNIDLLSFSAHKFYGPKGIGVLYTKHPCLIPLIHGGNHEKGMRAGTLATHQIIGMAEALHLTQKNIMNEIARIKYLKKMLWNGIRNIPGISLNSNLNNTTPYIINIRFKNIFNKLLLLEMHNIAVSLSSACMTNSYKLSHVLQSLGLTTKEIQSSIRISFGIFTTIQDINVTISAIHVAIHKIRHHNTFYSI
ncbi:aminotransferase class V-fold PLP-dependent enzyme [Enterobacteriaceae endosymbiont of Macroplea mutica]|uniref:cysteine desulfurase family protein n=1 Tax=Enterobacteriaceae endosymbiont of Macroplea mutica TaxID=2675791 RepID=UPI0014490A7D|nr:cysteine desulfurase family protein [Enterobacteriaceae endosymbiont of Macroplea mutica]QJC31360.1 aminotransferase class V-fold PLP-dependent enzyme [Enterobacteriaceae endosymbiont of Macroplea mutica]